VKAIVVLVNPDGDQFALPTSAISVDEGYRAAMDAVSELCDGDHSLGILSGYEGQHIVVTCRGRDQTAIDQLSKRLWGLVNGDMPQTPSIIPRKDVGVALMREGHGTADDNLEWLKSRDADADLCGGPPARQELTDETEYNSRHVTH
jgi:hypothetical protein